MTTGNVLYLLMTIAMFGAFSAVLAYQSWQQSRHASDVLPVAHHETEDAITA
jgi:hypothetical protein